MSCTTCAPRKPWDLSFLAEPEEVAALRRIMRLHLGLWGLHEVIDAAQLCVSELVSNVITHVGRGTPTTLAVSMNGNRLRIEVHDPDTRALPTLTNANEDAESGRGMTLIDVTADCWGIQLLADRKVTWCELGTGLTTCGGDSADPRVAAAQGWLDLYSGGKLPPPAGPSRLRALAAEETAITAITDLLHWLRAQGCDPDEVLDRAQTRCEAEWDVRSCCLSGLEDCVCAGRA